MAVAYIRDRDAEGEKYRAGIRQNQLTDTKLRAKSAQYCAGSSAIGIQGKFRRIVAAFDGNAAWQVHHASGR